MQQSAVLILEERSHLGSKAARKMRRDGQLPAVVYGHGVESTTVLVDYREAAKAYQQAGKHSPVELQLSGKKHLAMMKQVAIEPVKHRLQHLAFYVVKQNEKVQTDVAVRLAGEEDTPAERAGLILIKALDTIQIEAFPRDLPEVIEIDGTKLAAAGDAITVADIVAPNGVTILSDPTQQIISAVEPAALAAANDAAGGDDEETEEATEGSTEAADDTAAETVAKN